MATGIRCHNGSWPRTYPEPERSRPATGSSGTSRPGTILLAEDTTGKGHITKVTGAEDILVLILMLPDDQGINR